MKANSLIKERTKTTHEFDLSKYRVEHHEGYSVLSVLQKERPNVHSRSVPATRSLTSIIMQCVRGVQNHAEFDPSQHRQASWGKLRFIKGGYQPRDTIHAIFFRCKRKHRDRLLKYCPASWGQLRICRASERPCMKESTSHAIANKAMHPGVQNGVWFTVKQYRQLRFRKSNRTHRKKRISTTR